MRDRYQEAAATFRLPYWDWAVRPPANESCLPLSIGGGPNVTADGPDGPQVIANPLYSFAFKPLNATAFPQFPVGHGGEMAVNVAEEQADGVMVVLRME